MKLSAMVLTLLASLIAIFAISTATGARASGVANATSKHCIGDPVLASVTHRAGLVVTFGDRRTQTFCIEFSEDAISGLEQLQRSGLPLVTSGSGGLGAAVCSIGGQGSSDPTNCFSSCTGASCAYWAYYRYVDGAWKFSQVGASQTAVHDGDVLGWSWGPGGNSAGAAPEPPGEICPKPTATPIARVTPDTPAPSTPVASTPPVPPTPASPPTPAPVGSLPQSDTTPEPAPADPLPDVPRPPVPPAQSPESAFEGAARSLIAKTSTPAATMVTPSATPKSGAIVIGAQQGDQNQARSESRATGGGGSRLSFILFGVVAGTLAVAAIGITYWRRRAV